MSRAAKPFRPPIPEELAEAAPETLYLFTEHMSYRHILGGRLQIMEGRLSSVERGLAAIGDSMGAATRAQSAIAKEILDRIGQDDGFSGTGLSGTVGGLARTIGCEPDQDGLHGKGILGRLAKSDRASAKGAALLNQAKGGMIAVAAAGAILFFLLKDQLHHLLSVPVH